MKARDVMTLAVLTVNPTMSVKDVARLFYGTADQRRAGR